MAEQNQKSVQEKLGEMAQNTGAFFKDKVGPALKTGFEKTKQFAKETVQRTNNFTDAKIAPKIEVAAQNTKEWKDEKLVPGLHKAGDATKNFAKQTVEVIKNVGKETKDEQVIQTYDVQAPTLPENPQ